MSDLPHSFILATAGHVDHGKSALVQALTGTHTAHLPEEKARGMTIDLGFAHLDLPGEGPDDAPGGYRLGIVDVPGHEDFVKNMVAGVGSIDLALLVVAADDGWMPQTEEHLRILSYLGVRHGVVALSKADLVDDVERARDAVRQQLRSSALAEAPVVPTSTRTGQGLDALRAALREALGRTPRPRDIDKPRLPVDRAFSLPGVGTVVTGTLTGGTIAQGQDVLIQPRGVPARVRSVQSHGRELTTAGPGSRVALNLSGVRPAQGRTAGESSIRRGDVVSIVGLGQASDTLDVLVMRLARPAVEAQQEPPLRNGARVHLHHGSGSTPGRLYLLDTGPLRPGEQGLGQIRLERPLFCLGGDRFVLRDWSSRHTLGGGVVLDPTARRRNWRNDDRRALLAARAKEPEDPVAWVASELAGLRYARPDTLLRQSRFSEQEIAAAVNALIEANRVIAAGLLFDANEWTALRHRAVEAIDAMHAAHPERSGLPLLELRQRLGAGLPPEAAEAVIAALCRDGFMRSGSTIRRASHQPSLPPRLAEAGQRLRAALAAEPFSPPSRKQLAPDATSEQALRFLIINGEVVELNRDCVISAAAVEQAIEIIRSVITRDGPATVSQLKTALGSSRRIMVPLLEKLDRDGITHRHGDRRVVR